jgi:hypothetical protein
VVAVPLDLIGVPIGARIEVLIEVGIAITIAANSEAAVE